MHNNDPHISIRDVSLDAIVYVNGRPDRSATLPPNSRYVEIIEKLLVKKKGSWKRSFVSYAPSVYVRKDDFSINMTKTFIVVNYKDQYNRFVQVIASVNVDEYNDILESITYYFNKEKK